MTDQPQATRGSETATIGLSGVDRAVLARWAEGSSRLAVRARIVLACAEPGAGDGRVAAAVGVSRPTVACWRRRFAQAGLAGLADERRCGRPGAALELTGAEQARLTRWARQGRTGQALALRARIVLACAAGAGNKEAAARLRVSEATVARWRGRFVAGRLDGLADRPRPGRPPSVPAEKVAEVITATLGRPPGHAVRWSRASMARQTGLSAATIGRIWSRSGLRPHLVGDPPAARPGQGSPRKKLTRIISDAGDRTGSREVGLLAAERRDLLLARLRRDGRLAAREVAAELGLSDDSVRRDLRDLAAAGLCQRVYGGALPASPVLSTTYTQRSRIALDSKRRVAAAAVRLITPGSIVVLDGGSTALEVVMTLPPDLEATIITPSPVTAVALASHPNVTVHTLSGQLNKGTITAVSVTAAEAAGAITADLALLTVAGIHAQHGLTIGDREDAAMKRILIGRAAAVYIMASTEKLGTVGASKVADLSEVTGIITDIDHPTARHLRATGAVIVPAG